MNRASSRRARRGPILAIAAILLAGCAASPPERFYTLDAGQPPTAATTAAPSGGRQYVIGPVSLPQRVDRPQMVVRVAPHRVELLEQHRWAEPLKSAIERLLAAEIGRLLGSDRVSPHAGDGSVRPDVRVTVDVLQFDGSPGESVTVEAQWRILPAGGAALPGRSLVREATGSEDYDALTAAFGRAVAQIGADIAATLRGAGLP
jgi:hypothetical protein